MKPYTLIQIGMHSDASDGGVDRYFWGLNQGLQQISAAPDTRRFFFGPDTPQKAPGDTSLGRADLPLGERLLRIRKGILGASDSSGRLVIASHFALYALPALWQRSKLTHVVHFHGPWAQESILRGQGKLSVVAKTTVERFVYRAADAFITLSSAFRDLLISSYGVAPEKVRVVPGGVDVSRFQAADQEAARALLGWPRRQRIIFCVRRLVERMGIEALITAFGSIAAKYPDLSLFIGGKGPLEGALRAQIGALGLQSRISILGFIQESLLPAHYQAADLSIVPSQSLEGFGLTTVESLACGTPVMVTPVGGLPEIVGPLAKSCILSGTTSQAIAEGLSAYLDGRLWAPASADCIAYVEQNFTWEKVARNVLEVYDEAFRRKHGESQAKRVMSVG